MRYFIFLALFSSFALAQSIRVKQASPVYSSPSRKGDVVLRVKPGKRLQWTGQEKNGFLRLKTKSGRTLWISKKAIDGLEDPESDLVSGDRPIKPASFKRLTMDFGASTGTDNGSSFFEANVGLNYFFIEWASWRNAVFYRTGSNITGQLGLDSSVRAHLRKSIVNAHAGIGYRVTTTSQHAPFGEVGAILQVGGLEFGANVKYLLNSAINAGQSDTLIYSIILSGSGTIF